MEPKQYLICKQTTLNFTKGKKYLVRGINSATGPYILDNSDKLHYLAELPDEVLNDISIWEYEDITIPARITDTAKTSSHRNINVGSSNYAKKKIQPWDIWLEYHLDPWQADIVKRMLRTKDGDTKKMDYEKCIHVLTEMLSQMENGSRDTVTGKLYD